MKKPNLGPRMYVPANPANPAVIWTTPAPPWSCKPKFYSQPPFQTQHASTGYTSDEMKNARIMYVSRNVRSDKDPDTIELVIAQKQ